jgi:Arc/MetJ-type ribon-helix-helix transcriptional regulator
MTVRLSPEQERRLADVVRSGAYQNVEEVVDRALEMLLAQEEWLAQNTDEIAAAIEAGIADSESGKLIDADEVRSRMAARKRAWMANQRLA